jgi:hypothetical protein
MSRAVFRFLVLALPTALVVLAGVEAAAVALGAGPDLAPLTVRAMARVEPLAPALVLAIGAFEAVALVALYLLVEGRFGSLLLDGAAAGVAAWLFRGPLLVAAIALLTRAPLAPFWQAARIDLIALPAAGLAVGLLARLAGRNAAPGDAG